MKRMQSFRIFSQPNEFDNEIEFLIKNNQIDDALIIAELNKHNLQQHNVNIIGTKHIKQLIDCSKFQEAAQFCERVCKDDLSWVEMISAFLRVNQIKALATYIPIGRLKGQIQLKREVYDTVLCQLLSDSHDVESHTILLNLIGIWPKHLYNITALTDILIKELLNNNANEVLHNALAKVFCLQEKYDKSLAILLKLKHIDIFNLIRKYRLFDLVSHKFVELMEIDIVESIKLFTEFPRSFKSDEIVNLLKKPDQEKDLFIYLDKLVNNEHKICNIDKCREHHTKLVYLYSKYAPHNLLSFLMSSDHYDMSYALKICQGSEFIRERIFILARRGETRKALELIVNDLKDIQQAVDFCKQYADPDMWENLVILCMKEPIYIKGKI